MAEPPSFDGNELTDKGYINQRAGLERRAPRWSSGSMPIRRTTTSSCLTDSASSDCE